MATTMLRTTMSVTPSCARGMATLKDIETRLKSVKNIKKITSSMKMVSAAKFTRAEKALKVSCDLDRDRNWQFQSTFFPSSVFFCHRDHSL